MGYTLPNPTWTLKSTRKGQTTLVDIKVERSGETAYAQAVIRDGESFDCTSGHVTIVRRWDKSIRQVVIVERFATQPVIADGTSIKAALDDFGSRVAARLLNK